MDTQEAPEGAGLWLKWTAANSTGWLLGILWFVDVLLLPPGSVFARVLVGLAALFPGLLQWVALRAWFPRTGTWVLAHSLGVVAVVIVGRVLTGSNLHPVLWGLALGGVYGAVSGIVQWLSLGLRRWAVAWVMWSTVGWGAGGGVAMAVLAQLARATPPPDVLPAATVVLVVLGFLAFAVVGGAITGIGIVGLARQFERWKARGEGTHA